VLLALRTLASDGGRVPGLYRAPGQPLFDAEDRRLLSDVAPVLAAGARRGLLVAEAAGPHGPESPGLVALRDDWSVESLTSGADRWLDALPDGDWKARGRLPPAVLSVAGRVLRTTTHPDAPGRSRSPVC
jgi:hypothetical protein